MFSLGITIRKYREMEKITIVEYNFYAKKNQKMNYITLNSNSIVDDELKRIIDINEKQDDCSFDEIGLPECVKETKKNNMIYDKYFIIYYGNDTYKVIYKVKDIDYLSKIIE